MIGTTFAHYRVVEKLGEGGMGVVWKALDTHLDRFVALKLLPPERVSDAGRKRRFIQEAKAASALNHPNIVTVYDIAESDGALFMAMEYIAGRTLDHAIGRKGLKLSTALKYAVQIADSLAKAHAAGIIHRDLKPSNIMITDDGLVKVLDFGLAKLTEPANSDESAPTETLLAEEKPLTEEGTIVGTVSYMSPEQAEGKPVDARSDMFSFGSVLYEMITGRRAFQGETRVSTLASILHHEPVSVHEIVGEVPREVESIIQRCLRKDLDRRIQHMRDLKLALEELKDQSESGSLIATGPGAPHIARRRWLAPALFAALAIGAIVWFTFGGPKATPVSRTIPVTSFPGLELQPAISPDGKQIAFVWDGGKPDQMDIFVKLIDAGSPLQLTKNAGFHDSPAWSPDGRYIAYVRRSADASGIFMIPALGGQERKLSHDASYSSLSPSISWSPDGRWLAVSERPWSAEAGLFLLSVETGQKQKLTTTGLSSNDWNPVFSPDGRILAFIRNRSPSSSDLYEIPILANGAPAAEPKRLTSDERFIAGLDWTPDGRFIVFSSERDGANRLWRVPAAGGSPERLSAGGENVFQLSIARHTPTGEPRLAYTQGVWDTNIWRLSADGSSAPSRIIASTREDYHPQYSPDGKRIAFASKRSGWEEIWTSESDGSNPAQLTFFAGPSNGCPRWSPDGRWIAFDSPKAGNGDIYVVDSQGGNPRQFTTEPSDEVRPSWSRDGRSIYFASNRGNRWQIWREPAEGGRQEQVTQTEGREAFESADGSFVYFVKNSVPGVWRIPLAGGPESQVLPQGSSGRWALTQDGIYVMNASQAIEFFSFATQKNSRIADLSSDRQSPSHGPQPSVSPDRRWILYGKPDLLESDIMLLENFR